MTFSLSRHVSPATQIFNGTRWSICLHLQQCDGFMAHILDSFLKFTRGNNAAWNTGEGLNLYSLSNWDDTINIRWKWTVGRILNASCKISGKRKLLGFRWETNVLCISGKKMYGCEQGLTGYRESG